MKKIYDFLKDESGVAELMEAAIIYPFVFICLFILIYMGLFILHSFTAASYAEKLALLASREIAYPGYIEMVAGKSSQYAAYSNSSVELDKSLTTIQINTDPRAVETRAYRYWSRSDKLVTEDARKELSTIMTNMMNNGAILRTNGIVNVDFDSSNYFIVQYVTVEVTQPLMRFPLLSAFGITTPTVKASATAAVNDTDEFIRNVDFVMDALENLADKLGIDVRSIKQKIQEAKEKIGLN